VGSAAASATPYTTFSLPVRDDGILDVHDTVIGPGPDDQRARWGVVSLYLTEKCGVDSDGVLTAEIRHSRIPIATGSASL
jgi:hypothetical protein